MTGQPETIEVSAAMQAACFRAGARMPEQSHIEQCLANARKRNYVRADWGSELVDWMIRQKGFDSSKPRTKQLPADQWVDDYPDTPPKEAAK